MSHNITPIVNAEAQKHINEFLKQGFSEEESIRKALDKIKELKKKDPLVAMYWELEKSLIEKQIKLREKNGRI
jgi:hypothetical protein